MVKWAEKHRIILLHLPKQECVRGGSPGECVSILNLDFHRFEPQAHVAALGESAVHLWLLPAAMAPGCHDELLAELDAAERERAFRFHFQRDRHLFVIRRASLRRLLGVYTQRRASELRLSNGPAGKPRLATGNGSPRISFNVASTDHWVLIGVTGGAPIGVDVEAVRDIPEHEEIASRHFAPGERECLRLLPARDRMEGFLACWTLKEACVKATGEGLSAALPQFDVLSDPGFVRTDGGPPAWEHMAGLRSLRLRPAPGCVAAVAVRIAEPELTCFGFTPP